MKKYIFNSLAFLGVILTGVFSFFNIWAVNTNGVVNEGYMYNIFDKFPKVLFDAYQFAGQKFQSIWATLVMITVIIALVAGVTYIVFTILEWCNINKLKNSLVKKISAIVLLTCFVLVFVFSALFTSTNYIELSENPLSYTEMMGQPVLYALLASLLLSGVFGLIATCKKKDKE